MTPNMKSLSLTIVAVLVLMCVEMNAKLTENDSNEAVPEMKITKRIQDGAALLFADEFKQTFDRYLFGICPQTFKIQLNRGKNTTTPVCDLDTEQQDLAGRLATLALRVHTAARADCSRFGVALASALGDLARTANNRQALSAASIESNEANKKRKLSKSQKAKLQAKQRTALAVKKKAAAAAAAAAAAKMASA